MQRRRRVAAYGVCRRGGEVLLVRGAAATPLAGLWLLPGGGVEHGEDPIDAVVREVEEETGLIAEPDALVAVVTDVERLPERGVVRHHDRLIFDLRVTGGDLRDELDGTTDRAEWVAVDDLRARPLLPFTARALGLRVPDPADAELVAAGPPTTGGPGQASDADTVTIIPGGVGGTVESGVMRRRQRFAAYGLVTGPDGRVLLTLIAQGYPGAGRWHLPGGGTEFGEAAADALLREVVEETNQRAHLRGLIAASHRHHRDAIGPEGVPIDWHGIRVVYAGVVDEPTSPTVVEADGGSTSAADWFSPQEALKLPLTEIARSMIEEHLPSGPVK